MNFRPAFVLLAASFLAGTAGSAFAGPVAPFVVAQAEGEQPAVEIPPPDSDGQNQQKRKQRNQAEDEAQKNQRERRQQAQEELRQKLEQRQKQREERNRNRGSGQAAEDGNGQGATQRERRQQAEEELRQKLERRQKQREERRKAAEQQQKQAAPGAEAGQLPHGQGDRKTRAQEELRRKLEERRKKNTGDGQPSRPAVVIPPIETEEPPKAEAGPGSGSQSERPAVEIPPIETEEPPKAETAPGSGPGPQPEQPAVTGEPPKPELPKAAGDRGKADRADVMRFLRDRRDPGSLSDSELRERAGAAGGFLGDESLSANVRERLEREQREAERELARRAGGQDQTKPVEPETAGPSAPVSPPPAAVDQARRLTDQELRQRVRDSRRQLDRGDVSGDARTRLEGQLAADREELQRRVGANAGGRIPEEAIERPEKAREEATAIVRDPRPARDLSVEDLRERVNRNRALLAVEGLADEDRRELRRRLAEDREALRERAAAERREERDRDRPDQPRPPGRFDDWDDPDWDRVGDRPGWEDALADRRPSRALSERELNRRIRATRTAIERGYGGVPRPVLVERLRDDRRELRRRMRDWRDERDDWWDRHDDDVNIGINIMIVPGLPPYPRPPIEYAEVDDEMLGEWLIAPPTMPIDRRYTVDEIEEYPAIRQAMPGVEIDSIRFGFNQDFVPEEEIGELSRIGEMLEAILRSNPGEVFLIEGHTDAVGSAGYNLDLSRRRAASVKAALTDFFNIDPDALETVGYGEQFLKIPTPDEDPENRRVTIRRITPLVGQR